MTRAIPVFLILGLLCGCRSQTATGNETGGVIPWFATNDKLVFEEASRHCGQYGKKARIRDIRAEAGGHAMFDCI